MNNFIISGFLEHQSTQFVYYSWFFRKCFVFNMMRDSFRRHENTNSTILIVGYWSGTSLSLFFKTFELALIADFTSWKNWTQTVKTDMNIEWNLCLSQRKIRKFILTIIWPVGKKSKGFHNWMSFPSQRTDLIFSDAPWMCLMS